MTATNQAGAFSLMRRMSKRRLAGLVLLAVFFMTWFTWLRPTALGGPLSMIRVSGHSMEPGMFTGDLALTREDATYDVGEVIAFRVPAPDGEQGPYVIHRVVAKEHGVMTMRGDNNNSNDPWTVRESDVAGQLWLHVPAAGRVLGVLSEPVVLGALAASTTMFLVLLGDTRPRDRSRPRTRPLRRAAHV